MYEVASYGPETGRKVEVTYEDRAQAEAHAERLRITGTYASVEEPSLAITQLSCAVGQEGEES